MLQKIFQILCLTLILLKIKGLELKAIIQVAPTLFKIM